MSGLGALGAVAALLLSGGPPEEESVRFLVKGDWGDATPAQAAVTRRMCAAARRGAPVAFVLTTGDNFSRPDGEATPQSFGRPESCLRRLGIPYRAAWGNHDVAGDATARVLGAPARRYAFRAGPARFVVLDGNAPPGGAQARFLRRALRGARAPVRVAVVHQPLRTAGVHGPAEEARREWEPMFRRHGVALVLQGHNHLYERIVADGITYVTTAGGGAQLYPCVRPTPGLRACRLAHHFLDVTASGEGLDVRAVDVRGRVIERFRVPARAG